MSTCSYRTFLFYLDLRTFGRENDFIAGDKPKSIR